MNRPESIYERELMAEVGSVSGASQAAYVQPARPAAARAPEPAPAETASEAPAAEAAESPSVDASSGHVDVQA